MKRIIAGCLMIALLLSMCACSGGAAEQTTMEPKEETQVIRQEIRLNEKITVGEKAFQLTEFKWKEELLVGKVWSPDSGNIFAGIQISFYNEGRKEMNFHISGCINYDNGYEITDFFGQNGYLSTNYPISIDLAAGSSYDLMFAAAEVTEYAKTDTAAPLWIELEFEGNQYIYYIRK